MFEDRTVVGLIEDITILNDVDSINVKARIDTGATRSSVNESIAEKLNAEETGTTTVKSSHGITKRKIVKLTIKISGKEITGTFSVFNRSHMTYPVLIGQNILKQNFIIDPKKEV